MIESNSTVRNFNFNQKMINKNAIFYLSSICAFLAISLTFIYGFHFSGSIIRRIFGYQFSAIESLAEFSIRPAVFFVFLISLYTYKNISKSKLIVFSLFFSFIGVVLIISPFSGARSIIFFLYFALILILFERYLFKWPIVFGASLFFGIFLSELQNIVRDFIATGQGGALAGVNYFFQGHFDGYEMLMHSISYVMLDLPVFGSQFIGAIFFWIPRAFWPGKPIGSGDFLAYEYIDTFSLVTFANFALPLHGELFLNFSFMGIFIGFFLIGIILGRFDAYFHVGYRQALSEKKATFVPFKSLVYCVSVGLLLFLYRGDMMSSFSFSFGIFFALWVTYRAATKNNSKQIK